MHAQKNRALALKNFLVYTNLAHEKVHSVVDKYLGLLPKVILDLFLPFLVSIGRTASEAGGHKSVALGGHLLHVVASRLIDIGTLEDLAAFTSLRLEAVVAGKKGEALQHVGAGAKKLPVELDYLKKIRIWLTYSS